MEDPSWVPPHELWLSACMSPQLSWQQGTQLETAPTPRGRGFVPEALCCYMEATWLPLIAFPCQDADCPKVAHLGCTRAGRTGGSLTQLSPRADVELPLTQPLVLWKESKWAQDWASSPHRNLFKNVRGFWGELQASKALLFKSILNWVPNST